MEESKKVVVVDVQMPFMSMVIFMIKWTIACIPAFLVLSALGGLVMMVMRLIMGSMGMPRL